MTAEIEIDLSKTIAGMDSLEKDIAKKLDETITRQVMQLERDIKKSAPVDTTRYRAAWSSEKGVGEWTIRNNVFYAVFLIYGTVKMGIKHNVRGILTYWRNWQLRPAIENLFK